MKIYTISIMITVVLLFAPGKSFAATPVFEDPSVKALHESVNSLRAKADKGDPEAQTGQGMINLYGFGGKQDYIAAKGWFEKAANQGYPEAMVQLGSIYEEGSGVDRDIDKAVVWYKKAADLNYPQARFRLGMLHYTGAGVAKSDAEGDKLLRVACDNGYRTSCGVLLWRENKVEEARSAFKLQCQAGDQLACGFEGQLPPASEAAQIENGDKGQGGVGIYLVIGLVLVGLLIFWLIRNDPGEEEGKGV